MAAKLRTAALAGSIAGSGLLAIAVVSGILYEQVERARDRERFPRSAADIRRPDPQYLLLRPGQPAVILESGATWPFYSNPRAMYENGAPRPGYSWVWIQRGLARFTTACWYDRAGSGWSGLGPYPRERPSQARDLHALLKAAGVPPPYVLAAESSAALDAHVYSGFYPAEVAGLCSLTASIRISSPASVPAAGGWRGFQGLPATLRTPRHSCSTRSDFTGLAPPRRIVRRPLQHPRELLPRNGTPSGARPSPPRHGARSSKTSLPGNRAPPRRGQRAVSATARF